MDGRREKKKQDRESDRDHFPVAVVFHHDPELRRTGQGISPQEENRMLETRRQSHAELCCVGGFHGAVRELQ